MFIWKLLVAPCWCYIIEWISYRVDPRIAETQATAEFSHRHETKVVVVYRAAAVNQAALDGTFDCDGTRQSP